MYLGLDVSLDIAKGTSLANVSLVNVKGVNIDSLLSGNNSCGLYSNRLDNGIPPYIKESEPSKLASNII